MELPFHIGAGVLNYGLVMGHTRAAHEATLGVDSTTIIVSFLFGLAGVVSPYTTVGVVIAFGFRMRLSWQMHRSYPTHPDPALRKRYTEIYIRREGEL